LVRNLTIMHCTTTEGTTCSLIVITTYKKQVGMQWYIIMFVGIPFLITSKVVLCRNLCT
jgi:hypothetical protein